MQYIARHYSPYKILSRVFDDSNLVIQKTSHDQDLYVTVSYISQIDLVMLKPSCALCNDKLFNFRHKYNVYLHAHVFPPLQNSKQMPMKHLAHALLFNHWPIWLNLSPPHGWYIGWYSKAWWCKWTNIPLSPNVDHWSAHNNITPWHCSYHTS